MGTRGFPFRCRLGFARGEQRFETLACIEEGLCNLACGAAMPLIIGVYLSNSGSGFRNIAKREQSHAGGYAFGETGFFRDNGAATGEVRDAPVAEPTSFQLHVNWFGAHELAS